MSWKGNARALLFIACALLYRPFRAEAYASPSSVAVVSVGTSSATVSFNTSGTGPSMTGYIVQASTSSSHASDGTGNFAGALFSSSTASTAPLGTISLSPQGLSPNTTYYLQAGTTGSGTTAWGSVLSTATLPSLVSGTTVHQIGVTSITVNWVPLAGDVSSNSAGGYDLQVSSRPDFTPLWTSSFTSNVALSTLTASSLTGGVTYYFRVGTQSSYATGVNYASFVSTLMPIQLGVSMSTQTIALGAQAMNTTIAISTSIQLTNSGNVTETYALRATTTSAGSNWSIGTSPGQDQYTVFAVVNSTQPGTNDFVSADKLADAHAACTSSAFTMGNSNCVQVPIGATRLIWVEVMMPLVTSDATDAEQDIQVTAQAVKDP